MVQTLARYRAFRYLTYVAAFVLWTASVVAQILVGAGRCCARNWREFTETMREVEDSHKPRACADQCMSPCCHYGCENVSGHRWDPRESDFQDTTAEEVEEAMRQRGLCRKAPDGWQCLADAGHEGPCPAAPVAVATMQNCPDIDLCVSAGCRMKCGPKD